MIALTTLKYLSGQKVKDAETLFHNNRNAGAIYLMGYALEFSFKRKVCQAIGFVNGFPESVADFTAYATQIKGFTSGTGIGLTQLKQIKNHDLNMLAIYSGAQSRIISSYYDEWSKIKDWNPEHRYKRQHITNAKSREFIASAKQIITQIA